MIPLQAFNQLKFLIAINLVFPLLLYVNSLSLIAQEELELTVDGATVLDPRMFDFKIPAGKLISGADRRVLVEDSEGTRVVAKIHVQVGDNFICLMPDGSLQDFAGNQVTSTEKEFRAAKGKEIADRLTNGYFRGFKTKITSKYVYVYNTSEGFAEATSRIIESMMSGVYRFTRSQRIDVHPPEVPLVVTMFRTEREYQRYGRMPAGVIAYYNFINNQVTLYEESSLARTDRELAQKQALSTIAHEGAHQILHNIGVQQRLSIWPMWLTEGMAEYYAPTEPGRNMRWKGAGKVNDFRMLELENYLRAKVDQTLTGETVKDTVLASRLTSTGYASAWSLIHYLAKNERTKYNALVSKMSELKPLQGFHVNRSQIPANQRIFEKAFGDDWAETEEELVKHLVRQDFVSPYAKYPHFVALIAFSKNEMPVRRANTFINPRSAQSWATSFVQDLGREEMATAKVSIKSFRNRDEAVAFVSGWLKK